MLKALATAATLAVLTALPVSATTVIYATSAAIITDGPRGTVNDRDDITNTYGSADGDFFELGYGAVVDFYFDQAFFGPGSVVEITNGSRSGWLEGVIVEVGMTVNNVFTSLYTALPNPLLNTGSGVFTFAGGPFNTVRLTDITRTLPSNPGNTGRTGGFDVDAIGVAAVPLPAGGVLLIGALGGLAALRRRKTA